MLAVSAFFVAVGFGVMIPVLPIFAASFGVTNFLIGLVVSAFAGFRLVTSPFVRRISDRFGHKRTIGANEVRPIKALVVVVGHVLGQRLRAFTGQ